MISKETQWSADATLKKRFAFVNLWHGEVCAELEFFKRLQRVAQSLGLSCVEISSTGYCFETDKFLTQDDVDFAISLFYESAKVYDIFSFFVLLAPMTYYAQRGYGMCTQKILTHDDFLVAKGTAVEDHILRSITDDSLHREFDLQIFPSHGVADCLEPREKPCKLVYVGSNWDSGNTPGKRHGCLRLLDETGQLVVYGPEKEVDGRRDMWKAFQSYRGEIPYDGYSLLPRINEHGISLAFSSPNHLEDGIATNKLFEAAAAGAVIIYDNNPFGRKYFGDSLLYVDTDYPDEAIYAQILSHLDWIKANPEDATELARKSQRIFKEHFALDIHLRRVYDSLKSRQALLNPAVTSQSQAAIKMVYILAEDTKQAAEICAEDCVKQNYGNLSVILVVEAGSEQSSRCRQLAETLRKKGMATDFFPIEDLRQRIEHNMGAILAGVLQHLVAGDSSSWDYFTVVTCYERIFHNHFSAQASMVQANPSALVGATAGIFDLPLGTSDEEKAYALGHQAQNAVRFAEGESDVPLGYARFIFSKNVLAQPVFHLLPYLNRRALAALVGDREVVQSFLGTNLISVHAPVFNPPQNPERDNEFILDVLPDYFI